MKKLWYVCMLLTVCLVGCNKTDDLWDDVNDLKTRVTALEKTVQDLNWNIEAVRELCKEGATITDEASALEYCGFHPQLVEGRADNIKVTRPEDLALAEFYLTRTIHQENT